MTSPSVSLSILGTTGFVLLGSMSLHATDYNFGSVTENFTLQATDKGRTIAPATTFNNISGGTGIYWRGTASDATYMHFDLGTLQGMTLNGDVSLNLVVDTTYGNQMTGSKVNTPNAAWVAQVGGTAPAFTAVSDATHATGTYSMGQTATWTIPGATFATYVGNPSFNGLVVCGASGTTAHFSASAAMTLTGNYTGGAVRVVDGTDWSAASWNDGILTLTLDGTSTVSGGNVFLSSGSTLTVDGAATLGAGNFAGAISNAGTIILGTSADQVLAGPVSGPGGILKDGAGTLTVANGSFTGGTNLSAGTIKVTNVANYGSSTQVAEGATLEVTVDTNVSAPRSFSITGAGTLVKRGTGTWQVGGGGRVNIAMATGGFIDVREGMLQTGNHQQSWTNNQASMNIEAGATVDLPAENMPVNALTGGGSIINSYAPSGARTVTVGVANGSGTFGGTIGSDGLLFLTKAGTGTQILTGSNTYDGTTNINGGILRINGDHSGATGAVAVNNTGTLQGTGTLGGNTNVNSGGTLAPGASIGTIHTKNVTFAATGTFSAEINSDTTTSDLLEVTGNLTLGGAALTVTNLGTAPIVDGTKFTIATYTGTLSGTLGGAPEGGFIISGGQSYIVHYADGGNNVTITATTGTPFTNWMGTNYPTLSGSDAEAGADPDHDGLNNLAEFAFKGDPTTGGNHGLTAVNTADTNSNTTKELVLTVAVRAGASFMGNPSPSATIDGLIYTIQGSANLSDFTTAVTETTALAPAQTGLPVITGSGWEYHSFVLSGSEGLSGKGFLRAKAE